MLRPLKLRHGVPVPLGHVGHAAAGVLPLPDGDGVVKPLPELPVGGLRLVRRRHLKVLQREDHSFSVGIEQCLPVGAVVEDEPLLGIPAAEVGTEQGEHPVFGLDLSHQHPLQVGEPDKAGVQVGLMLQMVHRLVYLVHHGVGEVPGDGGPLTVALLNQPPQPQLPVGQAGEESLLKKFSCIGG